MIWGITGDRHGAGSRSVARPAVPAVFAVALLVTDETAAAVAIEHHHFWLLRLGQLDSGTAQGFLDVHVIAFDQTAAMRVDVGLGPDHRA